jgi:DNA polymerase III sliding clamp (beta) subunit (PCNA family)
MSTTMEAPSVTDTTTRTLDLRLAELASIASLVVCASSDDVTPTITTVQLTVSDAGVVTAVATDRYQVAELTLPVDVGEQQVGFTGFEVRVTAKLLKRAATEAKRSIARGVASLRLVRITASEDTVSIGHIYGSFNLSEPIVKGAYPPVTKLFPEATEAVANVALNPALLASLNTLTLPAATRGQTFTLVGAARTQFPSKPGPVLFVQEVAGARLRYLIQPNSIR